MARSWRIAPRLLGTLVAALAAGCRGTAPVAVVPPRDTATAAPPVAPAPAVIRPTPIATNPPRPAGPVPQPAPTAAAAPVTIRVLLRAGEVVSLPEPGRRYLCGGDGASRVLRGPLTARIAAGPPAAQVGAFADPANAEAVAVRLRRAGFTCELRSAREGLQAVVTVGRVGESAESFRLRLRGQGIDKAVPLPGDSEVELSGEGGELRLGRRFTIHALDARPVDTGEVRVRGDLELVGVSEGVALVNVIALEEYLRGVVPAEMGPRAFPALEALKAQAVAARTYAVAHLGEYAPRGYDICATTACQVYQGVGVEHPLSDRAVAETAGLVATWKGKPIDAMYHSTCAGHTEDAEALLPERAAPYLRGVPCRGERAFAIGGTIGEWFGEVERLALVAERVAGVLGIEAAAGPLAERLAGGRPGRGAGGLVGAFSLDEAAALLAGTGGGTANEGTELLRAFGLSLPPPERGSGRRDWELAYVVRLAQLAGSLEEREGRIVTSPAGPAFQLDGKEPSTIPLSGRETVLERRERSWRVGAVVGLSGSPATLWCVSGACPVVEVSAVAEADWRSTWRSWIREVAVAEAGAKLGVEGLEGVRVARRGGSGRVTTVTLLTAGGEVEMASFAFRLRLGLPDTLFTVVAADRPDGRRLRFLGRGWGHGIGMCQNGAYGLAVGGASFDEILKTYYTGVAVENWAGGAG